MDEKMMFGCWNRLLLIMALLAAGRCQENCAMENLKDTCICVNDESCIQEAVEEFTPLDGIPLFQSCTCSLGREYTLEMLASILQNQAETDMAIDSLYMSGVDLISLKPLDRLLVNVTKGIMLMATSINSLEPLSRLESVGHFIIAQNRFLINFRGLLELTTVTGDFIVSRNGALMNFNGLGSLTHVLGHLSVTHNKELKRLNVLKNLTNVAGVRIIKNDALQIVNGFERQVTVEVINIARNYVLTNLTGFKRLRTVTESLDIIENRALMNISGFQDLMEVGCFEISENKALHSIDGFQNIERASCAISLSSNPDLLEISGFGNLMEVKGDLHIVGNSELRSISGFGNLLRVDGRLIITKSQKLKSIYGLENLQEVGSAIIIDFGSEESNLRVSFPKLTTVGDDLLLRNVELSRGSFEALMEIQGELEIEKGALDNSGAAQFPNLCHVKGSLKLLSNTVLDFRRNVTIFPNLVHVCSGESGGGTNDDGMACGMIIRDNIGYNHINMFGKLATLNGTLLITKNLLLRTIDGFGELTSLVSRIPRVGEVENLFGGLTIAFNEELRSISGFQKLTTVDGVLTISQNRALNHINLSSLENVTGTTRINANGEKLAKFSFESLEPLPFREPGCRIRKGEVPFVNSHDGGPVFVTKLQKETCRIERTIPIVVGTGIIAAMIIISLLLFHYILVDFYSPYRRRMDMEALKSMFASHLLALADVLSDLGFIITIFVLWDTKGGEGGALDTQLPIIGGLSVLVLVLSQGFLVISVFWGLMSRKLGNKIGLDAPTKSLMEDLKQGRGMGLTDWFILFPGLLVLDAEVIKHLPWKKELVDDTNVLAVDGFPHVYFAWVAFLAGLLEDLPQMALQIAFMIVIEEDDGWAITGAMASLTLSVADVMVKFIFPLLVKLYASNATHLTRSDATKMGIEMK